MEEAQRLTVMSPTPESSPRYRHPSPLLELPSDTGESVLQLLHSISTPEPERKEKVLPEKKTTLADPKLSITDSKSKKKMI